MRYIRIASLALLIGYAAYLYWLTVFSRKLYVQAGSNWRPFWTYEAIAEGKNFLIGEIVTNIFMFVPIGMLYGLMLQGTRLKVRWCLLILTIVSVGLSLGIELLQLHLKRGLCETDDIIHNTIGCLFGYGLIKLFSVRYRKQGKIQNI